LYGYLAWDEIDQDNNIVMKPIKKVVSDDEMPTYPDGIGDYKDNRIVIDYLEKSKYEFHITLAGDILVFNLHSNVFKFDENHSIWETPYLGEDEKRGFTGIINVYKQKN
jgi:hypothetical protein